MATEETTHDGAGRGGSHDRQTPKHGYRSVLAKPGSARLLTSAIIARLPLGMSSLAILLFIRQRTGSFASAGLMVGMYGLASALSSPPLGRTIDRIGQRPVLLACGLGQACFMTGLVVSERMGMGLGVGLVMAVFAGGLVPPVSSCLRVLWPRLVPPEAIGAAYAVDAVSQELVWTVGPLLVAAIDVVSGSAEAVIASGVIALVGTLGFASGPLVRRYGGGAGGAVPAARSALSSNGLRVVLVTMLMFGISLGCLEVAIPALARALHHQSLAGVLLACWSIGSMAGGAIYGLRQWSGAVGRRFRWLLLANAALLLPLGFVASLPLAIGAALLAGIANSPWLSCQYLMVGLLAPAGRGTEAFTFDQAAIAGGVAAGAALAGVIADASGVRAIVLVACTITLMGVVIAVVGSRHTDRSPVRDDAAARPAYPSTK